MLEAWRELADTGVRRRDAAAQLGVPEARLACELVRDGRGARLLPSWTGLLQCVPRLGSVMALTRNEACVIEKTGTYRTPEFGGPHLGQVTGPEIDLRLFLSQWSSAFALTEGSRRSLEFYGPDGVAVHKIHSRDETELGAWDALVAEFACDDAELTVVPRVPGVELRDDAVDVAAYRLALAAMNDTHDFFGVMRRFGLSREQALRLGGAHFARPVDARGYRRLLFEASRRNVPIMAFVGNPGCIEIHTGAVRHVAEHGDYFNVLDRTFNLHLREPLVERAWIVRKPTTLGLVSSLEVFDASGELVVQFFGERHAGETERDDWRALLSEIEPVEQSA